MWVLAGTSQKGQALLPWQPHPHTLSTVSSSLPELLLKQQRSLYPLMCWPERLQSWDQQETVPETPCRAKGWLTGPGTCLCVLCQGQASSCSLHAQPACQFAALESCHPAAGPSPPTHQAPVLPLCSSLDTASPFPAAQPQPASPLGGLCVNGPVSCRATQPTNVTFWSPPGIQEKFVEASPFLLKKC